MQVPGRVAVVRVGVPHGRGGHEAQGSGRRGILRTRVGDEPIDVVLSPLPIFGLVWWSSTRPSVAGPMR